ncbi:MAG: SMP-30/gluconolactonase/LRE family protein [Dehalococcoidia bacterium]
MQERSATVLLEGLRFPECPRWHDGRLWFVDMDAEQVLTVDLLGHKDVVLTLPGRPAGLGWAPDGRLLVVSMLNRRLNRLDGSAVQVVADLSGQEPSPLNDMVVDQSGRAYIAAFGFDLHGGAAFAKGNLYRVDQDGMVQVAAEAMDFPNGMVIAPDGRTLIVAETMGRRLTAFAIAADGSLTDKRIWAETGAATPDGICLDAEGAVWISSYRTGEFLRVLEGGEVTDRIPVPGRAAVACMLGGDDRRTLFMCTAETRPGDVARAYSKGFIETAHVDVPGAGLP